MNVADPERAFEFSFIPNDGVGLAREEFIINEFIKIHPKALIHFNQLKDKKVKQQIEKLSFGYKSKVEVVGWFGDNEAYNSMTSFEVEGFGLKYSL